MHQLYHQDMIDEVKDMMVLLISNLMELIKIFSKIWQQKMTVL